MSTRSLVYIGVGIVLAVTIAILALVIASGKVSPNGPSKNTPSAVTSSAPPSGPLSSITP